MHVKRMLGVRADDECKEGINYASGGDGTIPKTAPGKGYRVRERLCGSDVQLLAGCCPENTATRGPLVSDDKYEQGLRVRRRRRAIKRERQTGGNLGKSSPGLRAD